MEPEDIKDQESLKTWLHEHAYEEGMFLSIRACFRVLPFLLMLPSKSEARDRGLIDLPFLRTLLTEFVRCGGGFQDLRNVSLIAQSKAMGASASYRAQSRFLSPKSITAADVADAIAAVKEPAKSVAMAARSVWSRYAKHREIWRLSYMDFRRLPDTENLLTEPLWYDEKAFTSGWKEDERGLALQRGDALEALPLRLAAPNLFQSQWGQARTIWQADPDYVFWLRWYEDILAGKAPNWPLLHDIALIPNEDWEKGIGHIAGLIAGIEVEFNKAHETQSIESLARNLPSASANQIALIQAAMERNRAVLPPTFDAIEGLLMLEIERLQGRNFADELEKEETHRKIRVLLSLYDAITQLRTLLPETGAVAADQAEQSERVLRVYAKKFAELPRAKANEVVEGFWSTARGMFQAGMIGTSTAIALSYGLPAMAGVAIGTMIFAPRNAAELIKAAREALPSMPKT